DADSRHLRDRAKLGISTFRTFLTSSRQAMGPPEAVERPNGGRCELDRVARLGSSARVPQGVRDRDPQPRSAVLILTMGWPPAAAFWRSARDQLHTPHWRARFTSRRRCRAASRASLSWSGTAFPVPKYISSGVWPANAECGSRELCSLT